MFEKTAAATALGLPPKKKKFRREMLIVSILTPHSYDITVAKKIVQQVMGRRGKI